MLNIVALMGRLTADPELRTTPAGVSVASFTIAVDRSFVKQGEERQADFISCVAWRGTADFIAKYFQKGSLIAVDGSIQTRRYQDKDGHNRTTFEVVVDNAHFAGSKEKAEKPAYNAPEQPAYDDFATIDDAEDLPF